MHYRSFHPAHDALPLPAIIYDSRALIRLRGKPIAIESRNDIP
jgi:hypothetical protein